MSRIGKKTIIVPEKVIVNIEQQKILVKGPKGKLVKVLPNHIKVIQESQQLRIEKISNSKLSKQLHGLCRTLIANMIKGVSEGFEKHLEIQGVGFRSHFDGNSLLLNVGYSHPINIAPPEGIHIKVENGTSITVIGIDKEEVGRVASWIRSSRPPEPYKGKGIRYQGEYIKRKVGKAGK
uniref:Large ribosomal subunit protein uL6c n=1 Tax=Sciadococcus taiwanensis TaxID=3028030 RepID=A0A9Y1MX28_9RHOD|nr:ribosomal protein L6 [Sciadococcus taiwanensis]